MRRLLYFLLCMLLLPIPCISEGTPATETLVIRYLDVGQGDAAILQCGGQTLMIDGGDRGSNQFIYSYLARTLQVDFLNYVISTHPHDDHVKGLATALVACDVGTVYSPVEEYEGDGFHDFLGKLAERGAIITVPHRGDTFSLGEATVTFLTELQPEWDTNDLSLMARVDFGSTSFLFTGDAAWDAEQDALSSGLNLQADVLKVGHHGSVTSTSQAFLDAVQPTYAVISVGKDNKYGHPADETLMKLERVCSGIFRTDLLGTIVCTSDGETIGFDIEKNGKW